MRAATRPPTGARCAPGCVYRSDGLAALDGPDTETFVRLGIGLVHDLRSDQERDNEPDRLPASV
ncbi:tyrosine-protein phosphatase [Yinghuangia aomiensis]